MPTSNAMRAGDAVAWPDPARRAAFEAWLAPLARHLGLDTASLRLASSDASFRRYLRIQGTGASLFIMDAPPPQEDVRPFVKIAQCIVWTPASMPRA